MGRGRNVFMVKFWFTNMASLLRNRSLDASWSAELLISYVE
jgi:hypothetical protein